MNQIPEVLSAIQLQTINVLDLRDQRDTKVLRDLAGLGYAISPPDALIKPTYIVNVFGPREVELPSFRVDKHIREQMNKEGVIFQGIEIAPVTKYIPGGQGGASLGGLYFYLEHGPIVVSTTGNDALEKVTDAFHKELRNDTVYRHPENLLQNAVIKAMGSSMMPKRESIPVAVLSIPGGVMDDPAVARYFSDSKAVVDGDGHLLDYPADDQRPRASMTWQSLWPLK